MIVNEINKTIEFIKNLYPHKRPIPLHAPVFLGNEKKYLEECIDSTFVSSVGKFVDKFENDFAEFADAKKAVAVVNGTNALQVALKIIGVEPGTEVITQPLTFVATCNSIKYLMAEPVFVDVDKDTLGMSPDSLNMFLDKYAEKKEKYTRNKITGKRISACLPMHTFGHPVRIKEITEICNEWNISVVEDAAESIGSYSDGLHTGLSGKIGIFSFNGNKTITTGGGGMLITNDKDIALEAKHLTTTAKVPHAWEFYHDKIGYNFRMPNINAAIGCAQLEKIDFILKNKRETAKKYSDFFKEVDDISFFREREKTTANYWLNTVILNNKEERDLFLEKTNKLGVMTRPIWTLMYKMPAFNNCFKINTLNSEWLEDRIINIPSGVRI